MQTSWVKNYVLRNGAALSILLNTLTGGPSNQTFSARNWEWKRNKRPNLVWLIDHLASMIEEDHCMCRWVYWKHLNKTGEYTHFKMGNYNDGRYRPSHTD